MGQQIEAGDEPTNYPRAVIAGHRGALIMCVDDDQASRHAAKLVVERAGYGFMGVRSGSECVSLLARVSPRIILLDIMMAGMDGYETCRRIRIDYPLLGARVIYVSVLGSSDDVTRALGTEADDYIVKPFRAEHLRERIQHWLREGLRVPEA
jgi:DNA-binding response OmpR family regulator